MRTKRELYQEAMRTVALRRQIARANAEDARAEAEAAIPALRHAEEEVRVRGVRCALAGASGGDRTAAAAALTKAKQELAALLASSGRPADALEPHFTCKKCQDTGSFEGHTCECIHKLMQKLRREEIEKLSSLSVSSFDTMELRYYPNTMDEKLGEPVRTYMGELLEELRAYAEEFDLSNHLCQILAGNEDVSSGYLQLLQQQSNPLALGVGSQSPHTLPAEFPGFLARHIKVSKPGADLNRGAFQKLGGINRTLVVADAGLPGQGILSAEIHWINAVFRGHGHN